MEKLLESNPESLSFETMDSGREVERVLASGLMSGDAGDAAGRRIQLQMLTLGKAPHLQHRDETHDDEEQQEKHPRRRHQTLLHRNPDSTRISRRHL